MKAKSFIIIVMAGGILVGCSAKKTDKEENEWIKNCINVASKQLSSLAEQLADTCVMPRSLWTGYDLEFLSNQLDREISTFKDSLRIRPVSARTGSLRTCSIYDWTSGFFPGSLWYIYELTKNEDLKKYAIRYTNLLYPVRTYTGNHDIGFMINCSYGNAFRLAPNDTIIDVLIESANSLCTRFNKEIGAIRSWDFGRWNYPVIIDNMMNLDLLFMASKLTGISKYKNIAVQHANKTKDNHFRPDYTCWHVVSGYTYCYRETKDKTFLNRAVEIADMIMERVKTDDAIPYWDYDAPITEETPRDASAAAITASAFLELSTMVTDGNLYLLYAEKILKSLSSEKYLSKVGENEGFILRHSTGSLPNGSEIDTPINYADYYFLEALKRYIDLKNIKL